MGELWAQMGSLWAQMGSLMATIMVIWTNFERLQAYTQKITSHFYPYVQITFPEFSGERGSNEAFTAIQTYLSASASQRAKRFKAEVVKDSQTPLVLSMDDNEEITDEYQGVKVWWAASKTTTNEKSPDPDSKRYYTLTFHKSHRDLITMSYIKHVFQEGREIAMRNRQLKLYTNKSGLYSWKRTKWSHIVFEHPATFETLAMEHNKKEEIIKDLEKFKRGKEYYAKIGKAWKRGYLLYGPPGTGKSTMIAAIANFMNYDVYDLELTAVKENTELRTLLTETRSKSIIVIEDIDCSLDLTGQRKQKKETNEGEEPKDSIRQSEEEEENKKSSKVTLSGLLNFIDGIWSACGGERIIIFTTNFVDKLDPALIRRGRMDKHIELSYCGYEAFKVLAKNYLDIDSHRLFGIIGNLLEETKMTPADVAENLMPKSDSEDVEACLQNLIKALEMTKEEATEKAEENPHEQ